jgi:anaerobic ribonucleoside-triphosphate reductase activating protein
MYYGAIKNIDIANGVGVRVSLFVSGCRNHCKGCFQPQTWDFHYGKEFDENTEREIFSYLDHWYIKGFSLLGGEPFEEENQKVLAPFLKRIKNRFPDKDIWCWTGYTLEQLQTVKYTAVTDSMLSCIDVLVDGRFEEDKKDLMLKFRGSSNQRVLKKSVSGKFEVQDSF